MGSYINKYLMKKTFAAIVASLFVSSSLALRPRDQAPDFTKVNAVVNKKFTHISLNDYKGKYTVLLFYPFDFTYVCPTELIAFSDRIAEFRNIGAEVLGVSTDSHFTHLAWINTKRTEGGLGEMNYPLLADISKDMSRNYGCLVENPKDELYGAALRGLYIIDGNGTLRMMQMNDAAVGRSVDETLRLIQAFQHSDKHGEVCPAGWKPGSKTIKTDQDKKNEFF